MVMVMAMIIAMNQKMIDIHNHFLPFVDDGSMDFKMTEELLKISSKQGVKKIFLTPHVNSSVSKATREEHKNYFKKTKAIANKFNIQIFLGAEIYISYKLPDIDFSKYTMGETNILLIEFSTYHPTSIIEHVYNLTARGYKVVIAHVERYKYLTHDDLIELKEMGAYLQINCSTILKKKSKTFQTKIKKYIKEGLIDFISTDSHNITSRPPMMKEAYDKISKIIDISTATNLLNDNAEKLFF